MFTLRDLNKQLLGSFLGLSLFGFLGLNVAAQAPTQTVAADAPTEVTFHIGYIGGNDPVKITQVLLGDKEVPLDTPVSVSGQWLRTIGIVVQNVSPKPVISGAVQLMYPETGNGNDKPILVSGLGMGRLPVHHYLNKDGTVRPPMGTEAQEPAIKILQGESMTLRFSPLNGVDHAYGDVDQAEATNRVGQPITKITIYLGRFYFVDEGFWDRQLFYLPVDAPTVWKGVTPAEFYGSTPLSNR